MKSPKSVRFGAALAASTISLLLRNPSTQARWSLWVVLLILPLGSVGRAQSGVENYGLVSALIGQGAAAGSQALKNNSCAPTAVDNGLSYLEAYQLSIGNPDPFTLFTPNTSTQLDNLQTAMATTTNGTPLNTLWSGLQSYLTTTNPGSTVKLFGQQDNTTANGGLLPTTWGAQGGAVTAIPTVSYLAGWLNQNAAVEITILWGTYNAGNSTFTASGGGHEVTLDQIGGGTIGWVDPWGSPGGPGSNGSTNADTASATLQTVTVGSNSYLYFSDAADAPQDILDTAGPGVAGSTGIIIADTIEQVPEPGSAGLALVGGLGLLMSRRWNRGAV